MQFFLQGTAARSSSYNLSSGHRVGGQKALLPAHTSASQ